MQTESYKIAVPVIIRAAFSLKHNEFQSCFSIPMISNTSAIAPKTLSAIKY
jgi:hypothetical protein